MSKNPPAFPRTGEGIGIPIRDLFALVTLHAMRSSPDYYTGTPRDFALDAYQQADAMIAARSIKEGK